MTRGLIKWLDAINCVLRIKHKTQKSLAVSTWHNMTSSGMMTTRQKAWESIIWHNLKTNDMTFLTLDDYVDNIGIDGMTLQSTRWGEHRWNDIKTWVIKWHYNQWNDMIINKMTWESIKWYENQWNDMRI